jgi:hypothetical protein
LVAASFNVSRPIGPRPNCASLIFIFRQAVIDREWIDI